MISTPPATFEKHGHTWTVHKPGDPMPCAPGDIIITYQQFEEDLGRLTPIGGIAADWPWDKQGREAIIGWRYATPPAQEEEYRPSSDINVNLVRENADLIISEKRARCELTHLRDEIATMHAAHNAVVFQLQQQRQDTEDAKGEAATLRAENAEILVAIREVYAAITNHDHYANRTEYVGGDTYLTAALHKLAPFLPKP